MLKKENSPEKTYLLNQINEVSFAISDIILYLDTHPEDAHALYFFREHIQKRKELMQLYTENYGPLTIDGAADSDTSKWFWEQQPFPWEMEGGCSAYVEL